MYERYCILRDLYGYKDADVARISGVNKSTFSDWKSGRSIPKNEKIKKISKALNVDQKFLTGETEISVCSICGFGNNPLSESSRKEHEEFHNRFLLAKEKYPFLMPYAEADNVKNESIIKFRDSLLDDSERIDSLNKFLEAAYSVELNKHGYCLEWLDFESFRKSEILNIDVDFCISEELLNKIMEINGFKKEILDTNSLLINRIRKNDQLLRIISHAEKLNPSLLDYLEIQVKALVESQNKG